MVNYYGKDIQNDLNSHHHAADDGDDEIYRPDEVLNVEDWTSYYSDDVYNMWSLIRDYMEENGSRGYMMQYADYTAFAEFCYSMSYGHPYAGRVRTAN